MDKLFDNLVPYRYKYNTKKDGLETKLETFGVMAQDIRKGIEDSGFNPDNYSIVQKDKDGYYYVDYNQLIPVLIKEIKTLQKKVHTIEQSMKV
jgi:hypothetical protein